MSDKGEALVRWAKVRLNGRRDIGEDVARLQPPGLDRRQKRLNETTSRCALGAEQEFWPNLCMP
jgi:hypothetical protein